MMVSLVTVITMTDAAFGETVYVTAKSAQLRSGKTSLDPVVASLKLGETLEVVKRDDRWLQVRLPDDRPAGSAQLLNQMLKVLVQEAGVPFGEAVKMASLVPAGVLGVNKGRLQAGYDADLVVMDLDFTVRKTFVAGNPVYLS